MIAPSRADLWHGHVRRQRDGPWINIAFAVAFPAIEPKEITVANQVAEENRADNFWSLSRRYVVQAVG
jgi:hypothetical protein